MHSGTTWGDGANGKGGKMGRFIPTKEERGAGSALLNYLRMAGHHIEKDDFGDRPDLTFQLDGNFVGCEIVSMVPADMQQAIRTFSQLMLRNNADVAKITIPIEPDMWMQTAIERKWAKVQKYPPSAYTANLSLLVHYPVLGVRDPVEYDRREFINGVCYGQAVSQHGFDNIFYWSGRNIYTLNHGKPPFQKVIPDLSNGYPAYVLWILSSAQDELRKRFENRSIPLQLPDGCTKHIKPLEPAYRNLKPYEPEGDFRIRLQFNDDGN
jgi:hypothetical protein